MFVDLIGLANEYGIMIPPYFTMIFRAFLMFEGMALKTNPDYMIIDECYPYICKKLLTDNRYSE
jgi:aarF domain-containing kinase